MGTGPLQRHLLPALGFYAALVALLWAPISVSAEVRNAKGVAVVIGNGDYEHRDVPDVKFAHRDAEAFKRYVLDVLGFDPENVIDVRDATRRRLFDVLGTRRDPRSDLWSYLDPKGKSDVVVFYSGHGVPGQKDARGYLLPVDADPKAAEEDGYPIDLLYSNLAGLKEARSVQVFLDTCFSGGSHEGGLIGSASPVYVKAKLPGASGKKVTSLTAASGEQIASWDEKAKHGLFTRHLLDALYGKADADEDGKVTAAEAKQYLDDHMTRAARRMHRRIQHADLIGAEGVVLASVKEGRDFPARSQPSALPRPAAPRGAEETKRGAVPPPPRLPMATHVAMEEGLGLERPERRMIQKALASLGFHPGMPDGLFGRQTRGAIKKWQSSRGDDATGYLDAESAKVLLAAVKGETSPARKEQNRKAAKETFSKALSVAERMGDKFERAGALSSIAMAQAQAGYFHDGLSTAERIKNDFYHSLASRSIGRAQLEAGNVREALGTARRMRDGHLKVGSFAFIATAQAEAGNDRDAERLLSDARSLAKRISDIDKKDWAFSDIGEAYAKAGNIRAALSMADKIEGEYKEQRRGAVLAAIAYAHANGGNIRGALSITEGIKDKSGKQKALHSSVQGYVKAGNIRAALANAERIERGLTRVRAVLVIADAQTKAYDARDAAKSFAEALSVAEKLEGNDRAWALLSIGEAQAKANRLQDAAGSLAKAMSTAQSPQDYTGGAPTMAYIALAQAKIGNVRDATRSFSRALTIAEGLEKSWRAFAFTRIVERQAEAGLIRDALANAERIVEDDQYVEALAAIAKAQAKAVDAIEGDLQARKK